jgi:sugar O-acyltransferase (sialic acid O-acetyltransferase NeuD family)
VIRLVVVGGGGHASDVLGVVEDIVRDRPSGQPEIEVVGIVADGEVDPRRFSHRGVHRVGSLEDLAGLDATHFVLGVGWPASRRAVLEQLRPGDAQPCSLVHPTATVGAGVVLGHGVVVMAGVHLSPNVHVGDHACLSNHAVLGHDVVVGALAGIMPGAVVSGDVTIGDVALVGANATVLEGRRIGARARVGAGAVVVDDVPDGVTVVGVPARPVSSAEG